MKYMGSKSRHAKDIIPIILKDRFPGQWYIEPFVGGFNVIDKVDGLRWANDNNKYLIALFKALQRGWIPPIKVFEDEYKEIKANKDNYRDHLVGYIGFNSYGGKFFGGYCRDSLGKRNYWQEHYNNILKQVPGIKGIDKITCMDYRAMVFPNNSIIYCDPPYKIS